MTDPESDPAADSGDTGQSEGAHDAMPGDPPDEPDPRRSPLVVLLALTTFVLAVMLFVVLVVWPGQSGPARVTVPNLVGRTLDDARVIAEAIGVELSPTGRVSDRPLSTILDQTPPSGTVVDQGSIVGVTIATADDRVVVPDLRGVPEANAIVILSDAGLVPGARSERSDSSVPAGAIASQAPPPGTGAQRGSPVDYVVSSGIPTPTPRGPTPTPTVPAATPSQPSGGGSVVGDYRCLRLPVATARIESDGFRLGRVSYSIEGGAVDETWIVDRQTPGPGSATRRGATIDLLMASPFNTCLGP